MNNTLTKSADKGTVPINKDIGGTKEKENTAGEKESTGRKDIISGSKNTTAHDRGDKSIETIPEETLSGGRNEGEPEERNTGLPKSTGGSQDKVGSKEPDNNLNTVENKQPGVVKTPDETQGSQDANVDAGKTDVTVAIKDKGQKEKERKEQQVNGNGDPDNVGPNDTKLTSLVDEGGNTLDPFIPEITKNNTVIYDTKDSQKLNNSIGTTEGKRIISTRVNVTQYTMYRAGGEESGKPVNRVTIKEDKADSVEREEKAKEKEKEANLSFTGERLSDEMTNDYPQSSLCVYIYLFLSHRERLPPSASPRTWIPPAGVWSGA